MSKVKVILLHKSWKWFCTNSIAHTNKDIAHNYDNDINDKDDDYDANGSDDDDDGWAWEQVLLYWLRSMFIHVE